MIVPDGCQSGDQFLVETEDGGQFNVTVPPDAHSGMAILVDLPVTQDLVDVVIPDGCGPGDEFLVEHNSQQFCVVVPDGLGPGMSMQVEVPAPEPSALEPSAVAGPGAYIAAVTRTGRTGVSMTMDEGAKPLKKPPLTLSLGLIGGLELNLSLSACAKFTVGQQVSCHSELPYPIPSYPPDLTPPQPHRPQPYPPTLNHPRHTSAHITPIQS